MVAMKIIRKGVSLFATNVPLMHTIMTNETLQRDIDFYSDATVIASYSDYTTRVGCVAAKGNKIIAVASNRVRNAAANVPYGDATTHAECNVLNMLGETDRVTLYIARLGNMEQELPSRPCKNCMKAILKTNVRELVYMDKFGHVLKERL
jgi:deoxycytidylate deaminase